MWFFHGFRRLTRIVFLKYRPVRDAIFITADFNRRADCKVRSFVSERQHIALIVLSLRDKDDNSELAARRLKSAVTNIASLTGRCVRNAICVNPQNLWNKP
jgi:hypothetical protein